MKIKYTFLAFIVAHSTVIPEGYKNPESYVSSIYQSQSVTQQLINLYKPYRPPLDLNTLRGETNRLFETRQVNINDFDPITGFTPFQTALVNPDIPYEILKELVQNGATSFQETTLNQNVLSLAAQYDREPQTFNLLIGAGANPMHVNRIMTFFTAAAVGSTPFNYLLRHAKNYWLNNNQGRYARTLASIRILMEALQHQAYFQSNYENVKASLLAPGDYGPNNPSTTLSWLAYLGDIDLLKDFLSRFQRMIIVDINQEVNGKTAYDWAEGNSEVQRLIRTYGGQKFVHL